MIKFIDRVFKESKYYFDTQEVSENELSVCVPNANGFRFNIIIKDNNILIDENDAFKDIPKIEIVIGDEYTVGSVLKGFIEEIISYAYVCARTQTPRPSRRYCEYLLELGGDPEIAARCPTILLKCERCAVKEKYESR